MLTFKYIKITCVVLSYWTISISMVFANKWLLGSRDSPSGDISVFIAWIQCIVVVVLLSLNSLWKGCINKDYTALWNKNTGHPLSRPIIALSITYVGMLTFNNMCLKNVGVAFYQVARSLTLIFIVLFSALLLKKYASYRVIGCCVLVAGGFVLGVDQEGLSGTLNLNGLLFGVITSLFVSLTGIFTKTALAVVDRDTVKLTFYNNINASILLAPFVIITGQLNTVILASEYLTLHFWALLISSGGLSFLIAWISALQIDLTSPTTHHISANTKAVLQTLIAVVASQQYKPLLWWLSICMVVGGALMYAVVRIREERSQEESNNNSTILLHKAEIGMNGEKHMANRRDRSCTV